MGRRVLGEKSIYLALVCVCARNHAMLLYIYFSHRIVTTLLCSVYTTASLSIISKCFKEVYTEGKPTLNTYYPLGTSLAPLTCLSVTERMSRYGTEGQQPRGVRHTRRADLCTVLTRGSEKHEKGEATKCRSVTGKTGPSVSVSSVYVWCREESN